MLVGTTIVLTVFSALVLGILCGWAAISGVLLLFSRDRQPQPVRILTSSPTSSRSA